MKQYFVLVTLLIPLNFLSAQARQPFKLSNSKVVNAGKTIRVSSNKFSFAVDNHLDFLFMKSFHFKRAANDFKTLKDSVEYSPYQSKLYTFNSNTNEYVILWVTSYEYHPCIMAYYLKEGNISKMGELEIAGTDTLGENFDFPIESIQINKQEEHLEFSFLKDVNFKIKDNIWKIYKAGSFTYSYNIAQNKLEVVY